MASESYWPAHDLHTTRTERVKRQETCTKLVRRPSRYKQAASNSHGVDEWCSRRAARRRPPHLASGRTGAGQPAQHAQVLEARRASRAVVASDWPPPHAPAAGTARRPRHRAAVCRPAPCRMHGRQLWRPAILSLFTDRTPCDPPPINRTPCSGVRWPDAERPILARGGTRVLAAAVPPLAVRPRARPRPPGETARAAIRPGQLGPGRRHVATRASALSRVILA